MSVVGSSALTSHLSPPLTSPRRSPPSLPAALRRRRPSLTAVTARRSPLPPTRRRLPPSCRRWTVNRRGAQNYSCRPSNWTIKASRAHRARVGFRSSCETPPDVATSAPSRRCPLCFYYHGEVTETEQSHREATDGSDRQHTDRRVVGIQKHLVKKGRHLPGSLINVKLSHVKPVLLCSSGAGSCRSRAAERNRI